MFCRPVILAKFHQNPINPINVIFQLFYSDEVSASHVQVRSLVFDSGLLYPIFDQTGNLEAGRLFLQEMLRETRYSQEEIECSSTIQAETANCGEKVGSSLITVIQSLVFQWIATGNALLTSRRGQKGLLSVRIEEVYDDYENYLLTSFSRKAQEFGGWNWKPTFYESCLIAVQEETTAEKMEDVLVVSVYFWTDRTEFIKATDPYYQIRSDGTRGAEMSSFK